LFLTARKWPATFKRRRVFSCGTVGGRALESNHQDSTLRYMSRPTLSEVITILSYSRNEPNAVHNKNSESPWLAGQKGKKKAARRLAAYVLSRYSETSVVLLTIFKETLIKSLTINIPLFVPVEDFVLAVALMQSNQLFRR